MFWRHRYFTELVLPPDFNIFSNFPFPQTNFFCFLTEPNFRNIIKMPNNVKNGDHAQVNGENAEALVDP